MSFTHGAIWWSELMTRDVPAALDYYRKVCGWHVAPMPMPDGEYWVASAHGKMVAGIMDISGMRELDGVPPDWFTYIAVDDVDAAAAATAAAGGKVDRAPWDVPGVGRIAIVTDPSGASVGIMTPAVPPADDGDADEPGSDNVPV